MQDITIRLATEKDADLIADISRRTFYDTFAPWNSRENMDLFMNKQFTRERLLAEVGEPGSIFLLAYMANEPAGYVRMREGPGPVALGNIPAMEIARIYAEQHTIGKGVGSRLMQECIQITREKGKLAVWLGVWEQNQQAIDFYHKWGFKKFGDHTFILGNEVQTDWLMKKMV